MAKKPATPPKEPARPRGRPTTYSQEIADEICARLSEGEPLANICRDEHMPPTRTVSAWKLINEQFSAAYAHAREDGFDKIAADCLNIANSPLLGEETTIKPNGDEEIKKGDMLGHRKLQIETRLKLLAKWDPKRYGERMMVAGDPTAPLHTKTELNVSGLSTQALAEIMAARDATKPE